MHLSGFNDASALLHKIHPMPVVLGSQAGLINCQPLTLLGFSISAMAGTRQPDAKLAAVVTAYAAVAQVSPEAWRIGLRSTCLEWAAVAESAKRAEDEVRARLDNRRLTPAGRSAMEEELKVRKAAADNAFAKLWLAEFLVAAVGGRVSGADDWGAETGLVRLIKVHGWALGKLGDWRPQPEFAKDLEDEGWRLPASSSPPSLRLAEPELA